MEEKNCLEHLTQGQEVVLTYEGDVPSPVVLTYVADLPPAMCPPPPPSAAAPRRRSRRGLVIFMIAMAALLLLVSVVLIYYTIFSQFSSSRDPWEDSELWEDIGSWETTIPLYPTGGDFRLTLSEDQGRTLSAQEVYAQVNPSVVSVVANLGKNASVGTGVIMSEDGYIVTNYHVIEGGRSCLVILSSGYQCEAELVGYDADNDLAVLKVEAEGLPAAVFGSSDLLTVGDKAYAIGNPLGLELRGTLTDGIISAINRDVDVDGVTMTLIQTNAALNSGNSGGPLINAYGQVVGINTIKMVSDYEDDAVEGLGFAIPSSTVAHIVNCLISTGEVTPEPVLGITVQGTAVLPDGTEGLLVKEVSQEAQEAGIHPGDILVEADGEPIETSTDLIRIRRRYQAGDRLSILYYHAGGYYEALVPLVIPAE